MSSFPAGLIAQVDRDGNSTYQANYQRPGDYPDSGGDALNVESDSCIQLTGASSPGSCRQQPPRRAVV